MLLEEIDCTEEEMLMFASLQVNNSSERSWIHSCFVLIQRQLLCAITDTKPIMVDCLIINQQKQISSN